MGPLNTRNNETFFMDRITRGRPVLVPGHGGWLRQFGHVEDLAIAMAAMLGNPKSYGPGLQRHGRGHGDPVGFVELIAEAMKKSVSFRHFDPALLKISTSRDRSSAEPRLRLPRRAYHLEDPPGPGHPPALHPRVRPRHTWSGTSARAWLIGRGLRFEDAILAKIGA
jgi:nucleoside-diphosphate-sugar epimerase